MHTSPVSSLLVAALVLLQKPCIRNKASARLLLDRAAGYDSLSPAEREACRNLADDLDIDDAALSPVRVTPPKPLTDWGAERRRHLAALALTREPKGVAA